MNKKYNCGELNKTFINEKVVLNGWIKNIRKLGKLVFIDLYDRWGTTQIILSNESENQELLSLNTESVISIEGIVVLRKSSNLNLSTGEIEIKAHKYKILNKSLVTPFVIHNNVTASEETRLANRFLDLKRNDMQANIIFRSEIMLFIRNFLAKLNFIEIETPILSNPTPEGARDFLVPSRLNPKSFYALPQSPQVYKQILMASGFGRYFQIAKCFRDEDMRSDRQPEFSQLDIELSFTSIDEIMEIIEKLMAKIFDKFLHLPNILVKKINYMDAINLYGTDKPDLRFEYCLQNISPIFANSKLKIFKEVIKNHGTIKALFFDCEMTSKEIISLTNIAKQNNAKGLAFLKYYNKTWENSPINEHITSDEKALLLEICKKLNLKNSQLLTILIVADQEDIVNYALGAIRNEVAKNHQLYDSKSNCLLWVINFPMFTYNKKHQKWDATHHPFTMPTHETLHFLNSDLKNVMSEAYDIVLNGYELGGGSLRIHDADTQLKIFEALGMNKKNAEKNFAGLFNALRHGMPPHGGIALGIDRLIMLLLQLESIRDTIAFPKNANAVDLFFKSPSKIDDKELEVLGIKVINQ